VADIEINPLLSAEYPKAKVNVDYRYVYFMLCLVDHKENKGMKINNLCTPMFLPILSLIQKKEIKRERTVQKEKKVHDSSKFMRCN
jgi:hypothetical protein